MPTYQPGNKAECPHCQTTVRFEGPTTNGGWNGSTAIVQSPKYRLITTHSQCPECLKFIVAIDEDYINPSTGKHEPKTQITVWPITTGRKPVPQEVPSHIAQDYNEAAQVMAISPKASAALSRRCLQTILREAGLSRSRDLADQIQEMLPSLPTRIADNLDAVRVIGNFAAHPIKSQATGTIVEVELGEAEWNLDVLDALFDHYFVRPEIERKKREALNKKLADAGKPPLK